MRGPINVKSPNNITNWRMRFNSAFKGLIRLMRLCDVEVWVEVIVTWKWYGGNVFCHLPGGTEKIQEGYQDSRLAT
jgi:hypothetical protein